MSLWLSFDNYEEETLGDELFLDIFVEFMRGKRKNTAIFLFPNEERLKVVKHCFECLFDKFGDNVKCSQGECNGVIEVQMPCLKFDKTLVDEIILKCDFFEIVPVNNKEVYLNFIFDNCFTAIPAKNITS